MGQSGSFTRGIAVQRLESAMKTAVASQKSALADDELTTKTKAVQRIAVRLLAARLQVLKSRIAEKQPMGTRDTGLRSKMARMELAGVEGILSECGAIQCNSASERC